MRFSCATQVHRNLRTVLGEDVGAGPRPSRAEWAAGSEEANEPASRAAKWGWKPTLV